MSSPGMWAWQGTLAREQQEGIVTLRDDPFETSLQRRYRQLPQVRQRHRRGLSLRPVGCPTRQMEGTAAGCAAVSTGIFTPVSKTE